MEHNLHMCILLIHSLPPSLIYLFIYLFIFIIDLYWKIYYPKRKRKSCGMCGQFLGRPFHWKIWGGFVVKWDKEPLIGVIKELWDCEFQIHYWKGTYRGKWAPLNQFRSTKPLIDTLPKSCIILHSFELTTDLKLQPTTRKHF